MKTETELLAERAALVETTYEWDPDAFPGSQEWWGLSAAWQKVQAWDDAHPGIRADAVRTSTKTGLEGKK